MPTSTTYALINDITPNRATICQLGTYAEIDEILVRDFTAPNGREQAKIIEAADGAEIGDRVWL